MLQQNRSISEDKVEVVKKERIRLASFDEDSPCPLCDAPTRLIDGGVEVDREGIRINMHGLKLMGGDITKKTVTRYQMDVNGLECSDGHRFFTGVRARIRALCPMCMDEMHEYGSSLFSCTRCNKHFSKGDWEIPAEGLVLEEEGWMKAN